jgi:hypothetical protein
MKSLVRKLLKKITNSDSKKEVGYVRLFPALSLEELKDQREKLKIKLYTSKGEDRKAAHKQMVDINTEISELEKQKPVS